MHPAVAQSPSGAREEGEVVRSAWPEWRLRHPDLSRLRRMFPQGSSRVSGAAPPPLPGVPTAGLSVSKTRCKPAPRARRGSGSACEKLLGLLSSPDHLERISLGLGAILGPSPHPTCHFSFLRPVTRLIDGLGQGCTPANPPSVLTVGARPYGGRAGPRALEAVN